MKIKKTITEKGKYETYINDKGKVMIHFMPIFSALKNFKNTKTMKVRKYKKVTFKVLKGNKLKMIKNKK